MNDMEITDDVAGEETKGAEGQQAEAEGAKGTEAKEEDVQVPCGDMGTISMRALQAMMEKCAPPMPARSAEEEAERLLAAYAKYQQPNIFRAGQLVMPKRMVTESSPEPFGVVVDPNAQPGSRDAPNETLRVGYLRDDVFKTVLLDPLLFQPYVPSDEKTSADAPGTSALAGQETGTPQ